MFDNKEKDKIINELNKIVNKTYASKIQNDNKSLNNQYTNMETLLEYYNKKYKNTSFQNSVQKSIAPSAYEELLKELNHDKNDDKEDRMEGQDIDKNDAENLVQDEMNKSKMPSDTLHKEDILKELSDMAEDEKDIAESDVKNLVKAATIKAIYKVTLERYEKNRKDIQKHSDVIRRKDGDFALEDRLAAENREYEIYLQKLAKQYKILNPKHDIIQKDEKISNKEKIIKDEHNKEEEVKEKKRKEEIEKITLLYDEKEEYIEEMAFMSANPSTFDQKKFEELQDKIWKVDRKLCTMKSSPAVLIENVERDNKQEKIEKEILEDNNDKDISNSPIADTNRENKQKEEGNNKKIESKTYNIQEKNTSNVKEVIKEYWKCKENGDNIGAKEQYKILKTMSGSEDSIDSEVKDLKDDGKRDYIEKPDKKIESDKEKEKEDLGTDAINNENETAEIDAMDADVKEISKNNGISKEDYTSGQETKSISSNLPEHTLYSNTRRTH